VNHLSVAHVVDPDKLPAVPRSSAALLACEKMLGH
jgi:hypothetical protein